MAAKNKTDISETQPARNEEIAAWRVLQGQAVVVDLREAMFHLLNPVATRIWELIDGAATVREIIYTLTAEFVAPPDQVRKDCQEFINQMAERKLILLGGGKPQ